MRKNNEPSCNPSASGLIEAHDLSVRLDGKAILREISLEIQPGEVLAIVGPNGAGKTTLMKTLLGLLQAESGSVRLMGRDIRRLSAMERARLMAYVPQQAALPGDFTVREFLRMGRYPYRSRFTPFAMADRRAVETALTLTRTERLSDCRLGTLSGGEQRAVLIAAALVQEPEALFLDEPSAFLDPAHQAELWRLLETLRRETGQTLAFVTHDLGEAIRFSTRTIALKAGHILFAGPSAGLSDETLLIRIFDTRFHLLSQVDGMLPAIPIPSLEGPPSS